MVKHEYVMLTLAVLYLAFNIAANIVPNAILLASNEPAAPAPDSPAASGADIAEPDGALKPGGDGNALS